MTFQELHDGLLDLPIYQKGDPGLKADHINLIVHALKKVCDHLASQELLVDPGTPPDLQ